MTAAKRPFAACGELTPMLRIFIMAVLSPN